MGLDEEAPSPASEVPEEPEVASFSLSSLMLYRHTEEESKPDELKSFAAASPASPVDLGSAAQHVFQLQKTLDLEAMLETQRPEHRLNGQVAHLQVMPDAQTAVMTTADGEVWSFDTEKVLTASSELPARSALPEDGEGFE